VDAERVIEKLKRDYPDKNIVLNYPDDPTEIVCEIDPGNGRAIAVIDRSEPHHHDRTTEEYKVVDGVLTLYIDGSEKVLEKGEDFTVYPGEIHFALGAETWFEVKSTPPWSPDDHITEVD
jgi:mannose-6-phosphate isomerase-like protein (cupin superfamily)